MNRPIIFILAFGLVFRSTAAVPLSFEPNRGQFEREVRFVARSSGHRLVLTDSETAVSAGSAVLRMRFTSRAAPLEGIEPTVGHSNYLRGPNRAAWQTDVPHFARVRQRGVYSGIDVVYHANGQQLEFDFVVAAGADPSRIRLEFPGAERLRINADGALVVRSGGQDFPLRKPDAVQGGRIAVNYILRGPNFAGLRLGRYDRSKPLVIDPVLVYAALVGGTGTDNITATAVDLQGNVYVTGTTTSSDIPNSRSLGGKAQFYASSDAGATFQGVSNTPVPFHLLSGSRPQHAGHVVRRRCQHDFQKHR